MTTGAPSKIDRDESVKVTFRTVNQTAAAAFPDREDLGKQRMASDGAPSAAPVVVANKMAVQAAEGVTRMSIGNDRNENAGMPPVAPNTGRQVSGRSSRQSSLSHPRPELMKITRFLFYASKGEVAELKGMLDRGVNVNGYDYDRRTGLHLAASEGQYAAVKLLLEHGANVNATDRWGRTPLADSKRYNFDDVSRLLEEHGGHVEGNRVLEDEWGKGAAESIPDWEISADEIDLAHSSLIGRGAFGEIRKVQWRGTPVAVKMILPSLSGDEQIVKEFRQEVDLLTKLRHPNIVQFMGAVTLHKPLMLVTEFLSGGDLHVVMKEGSLKAEECIKFALDIARGMNYLHNRKPEAIIHRDLKPRNLLQDERGGHLKVADFGLSKFIRPDVQHGVYQMTGETGSYRYMAPEVYRHKNYDKSVDVYSFAIIVYEMFEGKPPFYNKPAEEVAYHVAYDILRPPFRAKSYPEGMKELIEECWANQAGKRPSFSKIIERLEEIYKPLEAQLNQPLSTNSSLAR